MYKSTAISYALHEPAKMILQTTGRAFTGFIYTTKLVISQVFLFHSEGVIRISKRNLNSLSTDLYFLLRVYSFLELASGMTPAKMAHILSFPWDTPCIRAFSNPLRLILLLNATLTNSRRHKRSWKSRR